MAVNRNAVVASMTFSDGEDGLTHVFLSNGEEYGCVNERGEFVVSPEFAPAEVAETAGAGEAGEAGASEGIEGT